MIDVERARIVLLGGSGPSTRIVYHRLREHWDSVTAVLEEPRSRRHLAVRRVSRLGWATVIGQILFVAGVVPVLRAMGRSRIEELESEFDLLDEPIPDPYRIPSVNTQEARSLLVELDPDVVVVNGTGIIGAETLQAMDCPKLNTHAGITPLYRGVHGGYWALREGRPDLVGTTVHVVDEGIDTGSIVAQATFEVTDRDNFATYPHLHTAHGLPLLVRAVRDAVRGRLHTFRRDDLESRLRSHPTLLSYLVGRWRDGVR